MPCRPDGNFPEILPKLVRMTAPQDGHEHSTRLYKIKYLGAKCQVLQSAPQRTAAPRRCVQPHPPPPRASKFLQTAMLRRTRQPANDPAKLSPQKKCWPRNTGQFLPLFITASPRIGTRAGRGALHEWIAKIAANRRRTSSGRLWVIRRPSDRAAGVASHPQQRPRAAIPSAATCPQRTYRVFSEDENMEF